MTIRIDRRQFLMGSTALLATGAVGAGPALAQDTRMRLIFWGSQARADRTNGVTDLFEKANAGTTIDTEFLAWNDYWPKLATQTAGGNAPDVIQMDYRYIVEYAKRGAIAPLDDLSTQLALKDFDQDQIDGGKVDGKLYGISLGANSVALIVNTAAFQEAGVDVPGPATTYEDLKTIGEAFKSKNVRGGMKAFQDGSGVEPALENWLRQQGKALYTADGKPGFTAEDLTAWFQLWADLRDAGVIVSADEQALDTGPLEQTMVSLGKAAVTFANSNQLVAFQAINKDKLTLANFPRLTADSKGGHYRKPSMFWSISGSSAIKDRAAEFVGFFVNDPEAGKVLGVERGIPCSAAVREAITPTLDEGSQIALKFVSGLGDLLGPLPPSPPANAGEVATALLTKSQEVAFGQQSPTDAGPAFFQEASEILSRAG
ncbi:ABC transporter substrate-binding protein [Paradevosia shaoguanensis]|uniref:Extracellular solute-binding protein n=1 Tax=Paradevosia shaoguanensis TaxID=1335043 RepID=A0AA41QK71_9HYPH|nr:extracellular solute-binding protein [Paradevosia shaoguanensis]MCF1741204.1 extracellular solute-binding protein [Paradevosia shaoguanensis]MCI0125687.1 extracellular solute-binding protein [Paradevosia shaoguanensis]